MKYSRYLENRMANIKINNTGMVNEIKKRVTIDGKCNFEGRVFKYKYIGEIDVLFNDFIGLGKKLYNINSDKITKIKCGNGWVSASLEFALLDFSEEYNEQTQEVLEEWIGNKPNVYIDVDLDYNFYKIETKTLVDLSIFSYLVLCSFDNYYTTRNMDNISFKDFIDSEEEKIGCWINAISTIMQAYELNYVKAEPTHDRRPLLKEQTELIYNENTEEIEMVRVYENIYSLFWLMLKMHIYAITKEEKIVRLCGCGNVILGKSPRCDTCRLSYNAKRKANQRKRNKEKLISNNT